jgi:hypothetical protein
MSATVEVRNRLVGGSRGDASVPVLLEFETSEVTAAELIRRAVAQQVRELRATRGLGPDEVHEILARLYLAHDHALDRDVEGSAQSAGRGSPDAGAADLEIENAVQGFLTRAYAMLVNGRQIEHLEDVITLEPSNRVTFLRLMAFSGG